MLRILEHRIPPARAALARLALAFVLVLACFSTQAGAGVLELDKLTLDNQAGDISVRFGVHLPDIKGLEEELAAGTTVGLKCRATVFRRKDLWVDTNLAEATLVSPLRKDVLANDYVIELPDEGRTLRDKDLGVLLVKAWGRLAMDLGPWETLLPKHDYRLRMEISMDRLEVPVWMRYVVFFWSFDLYEPVSYQLDFSY